MNRYFIILLSLGILSCCSQNEAVSVDDAGDQPIGFTTYSIREVTKAGDMGEGDSFNVAAYYTSGTEELYFESQLFTYSSPSSCFISSPVRYWPNIGALDFYAVSPATLTADKTVPSFTADGHTDFTAVCLSNQKRPSSTGDSPLLNFGHKLTKVAFKAKGSDTNLKYVISSATLTAGSVAAYTFDKLGDGSWTVASTSKTYTAASSKTIGYNTSGTVSFGDPLFLIPSQGTAAETVNLSLSYKVYQKDSKGGDHLVYSCTKSVDLTASAQTDWGINKSVLYSLTLPASDASHVISFTSSVSDWGAEIDPFNLDVFEPIREALATAAASPTTKVVMLDEDYEGKLKAPIVIPSGVTLDLNGHSLKATSGTADSFISVLQGAFLIATNYDSPTTIQYESAVAESGICVISVARPESAPLSPSSYPVQIAYSTILSGGESGVAIDCSGNNNNIAVYWYSEYGKQKNSYIIGRVTKEIGSGYVVYVYPKAAYSAYYLATTYAYSSSSEIAEFNEVFNITNTILIKKSYTINSSLIL